MPDLNNLETLINKIRFTILTRVKKEAIFKNPEQVEHRILFDLKARLGISKQLDDSSVKILDQTQADQSGLITPYKIYQVTLWLFTPTELDEFLEIEKERWEHERRSKEAN